MTEIRPKVDESPEAFIKRFQKKVNNDGILQEVRDRRYYDKPSVKKHKDKIALKLHLQKEQKKLDEIAAFENANKFRPRPKKNHRNSKPNKPYKRPDPKPAYKKVATTEKPKAPKIEITAEALTDLQNKFKNH